jgi:release factor glutamine methyltransferase
MKYTDLHKALNDALQHLYPARELEGIARLVLESVTGLSWIRIRLDPDLLFTGEQTDRINQIISRLAKAEPIQYVLGETEFFGLNFKVDPGVLIPRGETEELVDWVIKVQAASNRNIGAPITILDVGCGSGAIAISLAKLLPHAEVWATDVSEKALRITADNAALNKVSVQVMNLDILSPGSHSGKYDVIVSNPPYIPDAERLTMARHVTGSEPGLALFVPDNDPLVFYKAIANFAASHLNPDGQVFVEIHDRFGEISSDVFRKYFANVDLRKDIHGKDRMIRAYHGR